MPLPHRTPDDQITATFLRGLTIGALVGAVIAGSSMLSRRRRAAADEPDLPAAPIAPDTSSAAAVAADQTEAGHQ
jgi:hypothetical protein